MSMIIDGTNGLTFNNATTQASAGQVLQVVSTSSNGAQVSTTSTSFVTTGFNLSITPKFSTSKILVSFNLNATNTSTGQATQFTIYRGGTILNATGLGQYENASSGGYQQVQTLIQTLDSPATSSSTTYTLYFKASGGTAFCGNPTGSQTITLMEIAG